jgi:hypothetical protein
MVQMANAYQILSKTLAEEDSFGDLLMDGKVIKQTLQQNDMRV